VAARIGARAFRRGLFSLGLRVHSSGMLGLQPIRRTRWDAATLSVAFTATGVGALALSIPEGFGVTVGLLGAALVVAVAGALSHPRTDAKALIALKAEGAALLP